MGSKYWSGLLYSRKCRISLNANQLFLSLLILPALDTTSIPVGVRLVWPLDRDTDVVCLFLCQCRELCTQSTQMEPGHLLIQLLGEEVHIILVLLLLHVLEEIELRKRLVGEGTRHDK